MDYGNSVQQVLLRKIRKAEQDLTQLKLDYCRFVFGLSHRARVVSQGQVYRVRSVDVDSMAPTDNGDFTRPTITGALVDSPNQAEPVALAADWALEATTTPAVK